MTDYIQWLLEAQGEEAREEMALRPDGPRVWRRRTVEEPGSPVDGGEEQGVGAPVRGGGRLGPRSGGRLGQVRGAGEDIMPAGGAGSVARVEAAADPDATGEAAPALQRYRTDWRSLGGGGGRMDEGAPQYAGGRGREWTAGETALPPTSDGGGWLYRALRRVERQAGAVRTGQGTPPPAPAAPAVRAVGVDAAALDRMFQRDARRYDGAFTFY